MSKTYLSPHWETFKKIPHQTQGAVGIAPSKWAQSLKISEIPNVEKLSSEKLNRDAVKVICQDKDQHVLFGYVCVMAWGGQGLGVTKRHAINAWNERDKINPYLLKLRDGELSRKEAFNVLRL